MGRYLGFGLGAGKMRAWKRVTRIHGVSDAQEERTSTEDERKSLVRDFENGSAFDAIVFQCVESAICLLEGK
jgi:hypothetical protein